MIASMKVTRTSFARAYGALCVATVVAIFAQHAGITGWNLLGIAVGTGLGAFLLTAPVS
jgi:hypothetical protein